MQVENLINYNDPDYTYYVPTRSTNDPFKFLCKLENITDIHLPDNALAIHVPEDIPEFIIRSNASYHFAHITTPAIDINTILAQTKAIPDDNVQYDDQVIPGYLRYAVVKPFMPYCTRIFLPKHCTVYLEILYGYPSISDNEAVYPSKSFDDLYTEWVNCKCTFDIKYPIGWAKDFTLNYDEILRMILRG